MHLESKGTKKLKIRQNKNGVIIVDGIENSEDNNVSVDVPFSKQLCPICKGIGKLNIPPEFGVKLTCKCEKCDGVGFIDKE